MLDWPGNTQLQRECSYLYHCCPVAEEKDAQNSFLRTFPAARHSLLVETPVLTRHHFSAIKALTPSG